MEGTTGETSTDGGSKPQKKQVCRFFTSKGKCYTKPYMRDPMTYMHQSPVCCVDRGVYYIRNADCMLQVVAQGTLARMLIPLAKMVRHLGQSRIAKAAMLPSHPATSSRGDTRHHPLTMPKLSVLSHMLRTRELFKWDRLKGATNPR